MRLSCLYKELVLGSLVVEKLNSRELNGEEEPMVMIHVEYGDLSISIEGKEIPVTGLVRDKEQVGGEYRLKLRFEACGVGLKPRHPYAVFNISGSRTFIAKLQDGASISRFGRDVEYTVLSSDFDPTKF